MALRPEGHLPLHLPHRQGQRHGFPDKARVLCQKRIRDLLVLLRQNGAGRVQQHAAGLHIAGGVLQNGALDHRQGKQVVGLFLAHIPLFSNDAETGAGCIHQNGVKGALPLRTEVPAVGGSGGDAADTQPLRSLADADQFVFVEIAGRHAALTAHGKGGGKRFSAGGGAHIQHPLSRGDSRRLGHQTGRRVLDQKPALPESR